MISRCLLPAVTRYFEKFCLMLFTCPIVCFWKNLHRTKMMMITICSDYHSALTLLASLCVQLYLNLSYFSQNNDQWRIQNFIQKLLKDRRSSYSSGEMKYFLFAAVGAEKAIDVNSPLFTLAMVYKNSNCRGLFWHFATDSRQIRHCWWSVSVKLFTIKLLLLSINCVLCCISDSFCSHFMLACQCEER